MVNNFEQIKDLLKFNSEDDFYFCQLIKRKKENPELGNNSIIIKSYYIKSVEQFLKLEPEMKLLADFHNARVCINLNKRSFERIALQCLKKTTDIILNKEYQHVKSAYDSVCGAFSNEKCTKWIVDIDEKGRRANEVLKFIEKLLPEVGSKLYAIIPTKNGVHLITKPFNLADFRKVYPDIDVHKNNPTVVYIP